VSYTHLRRIHFHECDPAGIVYFGHVFTFCHEAYEELMRAGGQAIETLLAGPIVYPLRHVEADYSSPMRMGDLVTISITLGKVSERSFRVEFTLTSEAGALLAKAAHVHVAVDRVAMRPVAIPEGLRALLEQHVEPAAV
jgi:YbgC/YbaW family acyl-CoA thioester hydrolase